MKQLFVAICLMTAGSGLSLAAQPALAAPPEGFSCQTTGNGSMCKGAFETTSTSIDGLSQACGFDIQATANESVHFTTYFNQAGQFLRAEIHQQVRGTFTNLVTGTSLAYTSNYADVLTAGTPGDFSTVTDKEPGQVLKVTIPGIGTVLHDVGDIVFLPDGSVMVHGPHDAFVGNTQAFCAAIA